MYTQEVTIHSEVGLQARPATFFIRKANEFKSGIWVEKDERRVNAKSLLGVLYTWHREGDHHHPDRGWQRREGGRGGSGGADQQRVR